MTETLTCERFFDGERLHGPSRITIDEGVLTTISSHDGTCDHHLISPGFVDLQINGWDDIDVATASTDDLVRLGSTLATRGTTSWLGTIVTAPLDQMSRSISAVADSRRRVTVPGLVGMHLEGPFLGGSPGAHRRRHIIDADPAWIDSLSDVVRLVTLSPENPTAEEAVRLLVSRGITVSLGHSQPTREQFDVAVAAGASMVTHLFNGMSGVHHRTGGLALWALTDRSVSWGLIADMVHVSPEAVALAFAVDSGARTCLVSDSVAWRSPWAVDRGVHIVDGAPRLADGTIAGSSTTLADCVRLAVTTSGVDLRAALAAATSTPARLLGDATIGRLGVGSGADIVVLDAGLHVVDARTRLPSARA